MSIYTVWSWIREGRLGCYEVSDTALEALRQYLQERRGAPSELAELARARRVMGVMRPYLGALI